VRYKRRRREIKEK
jgi:hypothetical protein